MNPITPSGTRDARDLDPIGPPPDLDGLAHRIGQGRHLAQARRHLLDARVR